MSDEVREDPLIPKERESIISSVMWISRADGNHLGMSRERAEELIDEVYNEPMIDLDCKINKHEEEK